MRINPFIYGGLVIILFFGILFGFQAAGVWSISGKVDSSGRSIQPSASDVNTIKGWMTLEQITTTFNVPLAELLIRFDLPSDTPVSTAIKDLESDTFDTTMLIEWLQSGSQPGLLPLSGDPTSIPNQGLASTPDSTVSATPATSQHLELEKTITGNTTFQDLIDWTLTLDTIQNVIGGEIPPLSTKIKDYVVGKGLEFSSIKILLQTEVDKTK
jgi:hypothetical protein